MWSSFKDVKSEFLVLYIVSSTRRSRSNPIVITYIFFKGCIFELCLAYFHKPNITFLLKMQMEILVPE